MNSSMKMLRGRGQHLTPREEMDTYVPIVSELADPYTLLISHSSLKKQKI